MNALLANTNYDADNGAPRKEAMAAMEEAFDEAVASVYGYDYIPGAGRGGSQEDVGGELAKDNPFFAKAFENVPEMKVSSDATVREVLED